MILRGVKMYKKVLALVLATVLLGGCSVNSENTESTDPESVSESSPNSPTNTDNSNNSKESVPVKTGGIPEEIAGYINGLNNGNLVFVDYTFEENPETITEVSVLGNVYDKALAALKETDGYRSFAEKYADAEHFGRFTENADDYLDENGAPAPIFKRALSDDFDLDGNEESFVMIAMPVINDEDGEPRWYEREYLFLANEKGAVLLADYYGADVKAVLDYGCCKQLIVSSEGWYGSDSRSDIWGVQDGKAAKLYGGRLSFSKTDCFLYSEGQQLIGDFAVYDINNGEYLAIQGKELTAEDIRAMDIDNVISGEYDSIADVVLIGGKYFVINKNGVYTYENGKFERSDKKVRSSDTPGITGDALNTLDDIDYDAALFLMITPE